MKNDLMIHKLVGVVVTEPELSIKQIGTSNLTFGIYLAGGYEESTVSGIDKIYKYSELDKDRLQSMMVMFILRCPVNDVSLSLEQTDNLLYEPQYDGESDTWIYRFYIEDSTKSSSLEFNC